jgi:hypothetical protein
VQSSLWRWGWRRFGTDLPTFVAQYAGDTLWALMVFLGISVAAPRARVSQRAGIALALAFAVEVSQLYHAPWINALRSTTLGGLVLGFGFLWTDLVCYAAGVSLGAAMDYLACAKINGSDRPETG